MYYLKSAHLRTELKPIFLYKRTSQKQKNKDFKIRLHTLTYYVQTMSIWTFSQRVWRPNFPSSGEKCYFVQLPVFSSGMYLALTL